MINLVIGAICLVIFVCFGLVVLRGAPFVPSRRKYLKIGLADLTDDIDVKNTTFFDIGSGNGVVLEEALSFGFRKALGYELNPLLAWFSRLKLRRSIRVGQAEIKVRDFLLTDLPLGIGFFYCFGHGKFVEKVAIKLQNYANQSNQAVYFMSMAFQLEKITPIKTNSLYYLYKITPCKKSQP